jgi:type II secretory pathway predicted ATPase ExeA
MGPLSEPAASSVYFETEAHYEIVAHAIRTACDDAGGLILVTSDPAPSAWQLGRSLSAQGWPRCDVCVIACHRALSLAELVMSYAARLGIAVAEAEARQQWHRIAALMRPRRGLIYVLALEHAEQLDDAVLDGLAASGDRRAPVVLIASETLARRLETAPVRGWKSAILAHLRFRELARNEIEAFIRFRLRNAGGANRDIFNARLVELIAAQAKGDPAGAHRLTGAILDPTRAIAAGVLAGLRMGALKRSATGAEIDLGPALVAAPIPRVAPPGGSKEPPDTIPRCDSPPLRQLQSVVADDRRARARPAGAPHAMTAETPGPARARDAGDEAKRPDAGAKRAVRRATMAGLPILAVAALSIGVTLYADSPGKVWDWGQTTWARVRSTERTVRIQTSADASPPPSASSPRPSSDGVWPPPDPLPAANAEKTAPPAPLPAPLAPLPTVPSTAAAPPPAAEPPSLTAAEARDEASSSGAEPPSLTAAEARDEASLAPAAPPAADGPSSGATSSSTEPAVTTAAIDAAAAAAETSASARASPIEPQTRTADRLMLQRGDRLLAVGEIVAARRFFERAADAGDADAACGAGKSYDPLFLKRLGVRGVAADPAKAVAWYRKAAAAGSAQAPALLERLLAATPS